MNRPKDFEALIRPHLDRLYRLAFRLTGTVADGEDLLQDVLIKLYARRNELARIEKPGPWAAKVLYNRFLDGVRRDARRRRADDSAALDAKLAEQPAARDEPAAGAPLSKALEQLDREQRAVLLLHDAEGYTLSEIRELTGAPLGTLKSRLHRARARMRKFLRDDGTF